MHSDANVNIQVELDLDDMFGGISIEVDGKNEFVDSGPLYKR